MQQITKTLGKYAKLLNAGNAKTIKGEKEGYITYGMHLSPSDAAGRVFNTCPNASKGCRLACLNTAGRGIMKNVQDARIAKTQFFFNEREKFDSMLRKEISAAIRKAEKKGMTPCIRLNLTSDIAWEDNGVIEEFPDVQFYDYTKSISRMTNFLNGNFPPNYHLTFSRSDNATNQKVCPSILASGGNVAAVFRNALPDTWEGYTVVDGDKTDLRFLDGKGVIVGLVEKGKAKQDETGFVISA